MRRCGNDQHGCDMAHLKIDSFRRAKMIQLNHHDLSHKHAFTFVRACEQTACTSCTLWVCILCTDHASRCLFTLADRIKPPEKPIGNVYSRRRLIAHHSLQQANFSCCGVRFVLLPCRGVSTSRTHFVPQDDVGCNSELCRPQLAKRLRRLWLRSFLVAPALPTRSADPCSQVPPRTSPHLQEPQTTNSRT